MWTVCCWIPCLCGAQYLIRQGKTPDADLSQVLLSMHMRESVEYLRDRYELPWSWEEILGQIVEMMEEYYTHIIRPKEGALELLKALKERGVPVTVATAGDRKGGFSHRGRL